MKKSQLSFTTFTALSCYFRCVKIKCEFQTTQYCGSEHELYSQLSPSLISIVILGRCLNLKTVCCISVNCVWHNLPPELAERSDEVTCCPPACSAQQLEYSVCLDSVSQETSKIESLLLRS